MTLAVWLADACRTWGLTVLETPDWKTRGRTDFAPVGVVCHHTAGPPNGNLPSLRTLIAGRSDLAGPLCNLALARDGTVVVVAAGSANHAGAGSWRGVTGNRHMLGIEAENDGSQAWPDEQLIAYQRLCAALIDHLNLSADCVCSHHEWAGPRKSDPHSLNMNEFRTAVAAMAPQKPAGPVTIPNPIGDDMPGYLFQRTDGTVYITNGLTKRRVTANEYPMLRLLGQAANTFVNDVPVVPVNDGYLDSIPERAP